MNFHDIYKRRSVVNEEVFGCNKHAAQQTENAICLLVKTHIKKYKWKCYLEDIYFYLFRLDSLTYSGIFSRTFTNFTWKNYDGLHVFPEEFHDNFLKIKSNLWEIKQKESDDPNIENEYWFVLKNEPDLDCLSPMNIWNIEYIVGSRSRKARLKIWHLLKFLYKQNIHWRIKCLFL